MTAGIAEERDIAKTNSCVGDLVPSTRPNGASFQQPVALQDVLSMTRLNA